MSHFRGQNHSICTQPSIKNNIRIVVAHTTCMSYHPCMFDRCLYFNINALTRQVNKKWVQAFEAFDLSPAHGYMLRVVLSKPGITQKELANELRLEKSTITRFVDALQKKKLISRKAEGVDGRKQHIYPTIKAKKMHTSLEEMGESLYQIMVSTIGQEQLTTLVNQLHESSRKME